MKLKHAFSLSSLAFLAMLPHAAGAQDSLQSSPGPVNYGSIPLSMALEPTVTPFGTVGMSNVISAEPLGAGRLGMTFRGNLYEQSKAMPGAPAKDAQVTTLNFGAALGLNPYIDGFINATAYNLRGDVAANNGSGLGTTALGAQATMPLPESYPFRMGLQVMSIFGTSSNEINTTTRPDGDKGAYGYDYLETRKYTDLMARLAQSFIFMGDNLGVKLHLNEGLVSSFEPGKGVLLVTGAGAQFFVAPPLVLGLEINDRTFLDDPSASDPLWITPSVVFRTPSHVNASAGMDISLSGNQSNGNRTLEPWRAFIALSVSYDTQAEMKRKQAEAAQRERMEKEALSRRAREATMSRDSLSRSVATTNAVKSKTADSLAVKAKQDSLTLAATRQALIEERAKRSEPEKQLLGTGMLLMDAVYFQTGKTDISINSKPYLNIIAKMLTKYPKLKIEVSGHTDNVGDAAYNMNLSQGRAQSVRNYMVGYAPSLSDNVTAKGYGMTQPKADNGTEDGRKHNRRIELRVMNKEVLQEYNP